MVLSELEEVVDVCVPRFEVDCEGSLSLSASLVDIPSSVIEHA